MTCRDARRCLAEHFRPRLRGWSESASRADQYTAQCPAHDDRKASLSVGIGTRSGRAEFHCQARCEDAAVRTALVRAGVPDGCLREVAAQRTEDELVSALTVLLENGADVNPRSLVLQLAAVVWHRGKIPKGPDLVRLGQRLGMTRSTVYRAADTDNPISGTRDTDSDTDTSLNSGIPVSELGSGVYGSTRAFDPIRIAVVDNGVARRATGIPDPGVSIRIGCAICGASLDHLRSGARYCCTAHKLRAARERRAGRRAVP